VADYPPNLKILFKEKGFKNSGQIPNFRNAAIL
jgi:hypothetical protein